MGLAQSCQPLPYLYHLLFTIDALTIPHIALRPMKKYTQRIHGPWRFGLIRHQTDSIFTAKLEQG